MSSFDKEEKDKDDKPTEEITKALPAEGEEAEDVESDDDAEAGPTMADLMAGKVTGDDEDDEDFDDEGDDDDDEDFEEEGDESEEFDDDEEDDDGTKKRSLSDDEGASDAFTAKVAKKTEE